MKISIKNALLYAFFCMVSSFMPVSAAPKPRVVIFVFADTLASRRGDIANEVGWFNSIWNLGTALKAQKIMFEAIFDTCGHHSMKVCDPQTRDELPAPFVDWFLGKNSLQVLNEIKNGLQSYKFQGGDKERKFIFDVMTIIFDPLKMAKSFGVVSATLKLIEKIVHGPAHPRLMLVANCNDQLFGTLRGLPDGKKVFSHFNDIYVSADEKLLVEDPRLYQKIKETHTYQASEYVLISSNKQAIDAAKSVGMQTVYSADNLYAAGKEYGKAFNLIKK